MIDDVRLHDLTPLTYHETSFPPSVEVDVSQLDCFQVNLNPNSVYKIDLSIKEHDTGGHSEYDTMLM
jgi:hypothetical protein